MQAGPIWKQLHAAATGAHREWTRANKAAILGAVRAARGEGEARRVYLVPAQTRDINAYVTERHYLHRGRTMAQVGYLITYAPAHGSEVVRAPLPARWTVGGVPVEGAIHFALPRLSSLVRGYHPMQIVELARLHVEPDPATGRNPPNVATAAIGAAARRIAQDWRARYPHMPAPRAILSYSDSEHHEGTVYRAAGFLGDGMSTGGKRSTRLGAPEHDDLAHVKARWILPLLPPESAAERVCYVLRATITGADPEDFEAIRLSAEIVAAEIGVKLYEEPAPRGTLAFLFPIMDDKGGHVAAENPANMADVAANDLRELWLRDIQHGEGDVIDDYRLDTMIPGAFVFERDKDGRWRMDWREVQPVAV